MDRRFFNEGKPIKRKCRTELRMGLWRFISTPKSWKNVKWILFAMLNVIAKNGITISIFSCFPGNISRTNIILKWCLRISGILYQQFFLCDLLIYDTDKVFRFPLYESCCTLSFVVCVNSHYLFTRSRISLWMCNDVFARCQKNRKHVTNCFDIVKWQTLFWVYIWVSYRF